MKELKDDLKETLKILSKYVFEYDNNLGQINPNYIENHKKRFAISMAHRNILFALNNLADDNERKELETELKSMRAKTKMDNNIEICKDNDEEIK
ncbi:hypothetical protein ACFL20_08250 [Spirochaetota bacterium]